ncbi:hypothetical protein D3C81_1992060 [compost metagenome]
MKSMVCTVLRASVCSSMNASSCWVVPVNIPPGAMPSRRFLNSADEAICELVKVFLMGAASWAKVIRK